MLPLGIYAWFGYEMSLGKRLKLIANAGFSTTCVWFGDEQEMVRDGRADQIPALVRDTGLILDNIHAPFWHSNYLWAESQNEKEIVRRELMDALSFCGRHHIPIMVMHLSAGKTPPPPNQSGLQLIIDLIQQAEDLGVTIAMENSEDYGNHYLEYVFSNIRSPNLGFCYDSSHDAIAEVFHGRALEKWGSLLATTHLSDNNGINDDHLLPGSGTIDWQKVMKHFPKGNYKGTLMLEVDGPEANKGLTSDVFLELGYQKVRQLAEMLEQ
jgi:sugar phosphate isomerase/epimerase